MVPSTPTLSVVIPTHKRAELLRTCLEHLAVQTIAGQIEVIVVSDGKDGDAEKVVHDICRDARFARLHYFSVQKSHQGVARNEGVKHAKAGRVLFIGDDIFLQPDACEKHLELRASGFGQIIKSTARSQQPAAILGFTTWDRSLNITPVMKWLEKTGWQFGYPKIAKYAHQLVPKNIQERFTYTSHISIPTEVAKQHPFREDVTLYGWEDVLWGKGLRESGIGLYFEPDAKAYHHHPMTMEDSLKRMETLGKSLITISKIDPELGRRPEGFKLLMYRIIAHFPTLRGRHYRAFLKGMNALA